MSNRGLDLSISKISGILAKCGYMRRRGRLKVPELNPDRQARIEAFLCEYDTVLKDERSGDSVMLYMDEIFVHR